MRVVSTISGAVVAVLLGAMSPVSASAQDPDAPPVVVLSIAGENVPDGVLDAVRDAARSRLATSVRGRPVSGVTDEAAVSTATSCADAPCFGALGTRLGAIAAVLIRVGRARARDPLTVTMELVAPGEGAPLAPPVTVEVPAESASEAELFLALTGPTLDAFGARVAPPPVRARLLVAVNIDGAAVSIDGEPIGESPVAAVEVAPGNHTVSVTTANFETFNRSIAVTDAGARVNVLLAPTEDAARAMAADDNARDEAFGASAPADEKLTQKWWFWAAVGGGALVLAGVITAIAIAAGGDDGPAGFPVPPIPGGT